MLVEDDKSLREIYGVRLLAEGYEITSAGDGEEALAMAIKEHPDLILSDVMMPKISGFDMLDILRATPETKEIKVIMMTALSSEDQRARGEALGANRYLVKSQVGIEDVVRTVHDVLMDVPTAAAPANQAFGSPAPFTPIKPQTINPPIQEAKEQNEPVMATPSNPNPTPIMPNVMPSQQQTPTTAPTAITITEPAPTQNVAMPQPTAPFSSAAPASLGTQIVNQAQTAEASPASVPSYASHPQTVESVPAPSPQFTAPVPTPIKPQERPEPSNLYNIPAQPQTAPQRATAPIQDVIIPQPTQLTQTPDMAALMEQELSNIIQQPAPPNLDQRLN